MARDSSLPVRKAVLQMLKANATLTAMVPAGRIYPATVISNPTWPFLMYEPRVAVPIRASCIDGITLPFTISVYAKPRENGSGNILESAEDFVARIAAAVSAALDGRGATLATSYEAQARFRWLNSESSFVGAETNARRVLVNFNARVIS